MDTAEQTLRADIVAACREMTSAGINQGTSGNVSARHGDRLLITPSATPYDEMTPEMIAALPLEGTGGAWEGPRRPSTEWRFHRDIARARPEVGAIVHAHPPHATAFAICRRPIPAAHYMVAAFGGPDVRCSGYATFGTAALSREALAALEGRTACLLANHGMIAVGETLARALWRAVELETLARQYALALQIGAPVLLTGAQVAEAADAFSGYGLGDPEDDG